MSKDDFQKSLELFADRLERLRRTDGGHFPEGAPMIGKLPEFERLAKDPTAYLGSRQQAIGWLKRQPTAFRPSGTKATGQTWHTPHQEWGGRPI